MLFKFQQTQCNIHYQQDADLISSNTKDYEASTFCMVISLIISPFHQTFLSAFFHHQMIGPAQPQNLPLITEFTLYCYLIDLMEKFKIHVTNVTQN